MNLTKISYAKPPIKTPQNHETEMKTRLKTLVLQPYNKTENARNVPQTYVRQKGRLRPKLCLKSSSPSEKVYIFLKQNTSS